MLNMDYLLELLDWLLEQFEEQVWYEIWYEDLYLTWLSVNPLFFKLILEDKELDIKLELKSVQNQKETSLNQNKIQEEKKPIKIDFKKLEQDFKKSNTIEDLFKETKKED